MAQFKNIKIAKSYTLFYHHYKIKQYKLSTYNFSMKLWKHEWLLEETEMLLEQEPLAKCF